MTTTPQAKMTSGAPVTAMELIQDFLLGKTRTAWQPDQDIFASGAVSSLFAMQLVVFLENTFDVAVNGADLRFDNFRTVTTMITLVARLRAEQAGDADG